MLEDGKYIEQIHEIDKRLLCGSVIKLYEKETDKEKYIHPFSLNLDYEASQKWTKK